MKLAEIMYAWTPAMWESSPTAGKVRLGFTRIASAGRALLHPA
jgi:hypothetical protein